MCGALIRISLPPMIMIAQHIPMVGNIANQSIIIHSLIFQCLYYFSYFLINKCNIGIIVFSGIFSIFSSKIGKRSILISFYRIKLSSVFATPVTNIRSRNFCLFILIQKTLGRVIRTMRTCKGNFQKITPG